MTYHITARTASGALVAFNLPFIPKKGHPFILDGMPGVGHLSGYAGAILRIVAPGGYPGPDIYMRLEDTPPAAH